MPRSPSADRLVAAAINHFADHHYEGASLSEIAEAVGIRKASLYTHFKSKDALFLEAFGDALRLEREFAHRCFTEEAEDALPGSHYCEALIGRYGSAEHLRFFLRTSYMPPQALVAQIDHGHEGYLSQVRDGFVANLERGSWAKDGLPGGRIELYADAYLGVLDSLQVKLIYTDAQQATVRLVALQQVLSDSLRSGSSRG